MTTFEETLSSSFLEATAAARSKVFDECIAIMQRAAEAGVWWPRAWLDHPDLAPMRTDSRFLAIAAEFDARRGEAERSAKPELFTLAAENPGPSPSWLLGLHGANDRGEEFVHRWKAVTMSGVSVAVPQSSQVFSPTGFSWHDRTRAMNEIQDHVASLDLPNDSRVTLGGFSQGAGLAIQAAVRGEIPASGVIAICPAGLYADEAVEDVRKLGCSIPIVIVTGSKDYARGQALAIAEQIVAVSGRYQLDDIQQMGHGFSPDFDQRLPEYLSFVETH